MRKRLFTSIIAVVFIISLSACSSSTNTQAPTSSSDTSENYQGGVNSGVFFIGGSYDGTQYTGQSMVHRLGLSTANTPIVMLPGLGLSAYIYTSTPDGRNGWTAEFAKADFDTYAVDTNNLAVSGMDIAPFNSENPPKLSVWGENKIWKTWGFGASPNNPYEDTQYPIEHIKQLYASFSPQITYASKPAASKENETSASGGKKPSDTEGEQTSKGGGQGADKVEVANTIALLEKTGSAVLMVHSMGGVTGVEVVNQRPDLVKALVVIEPVGSPTDELLLKEKYLNIPYLAVYGDYIESRGQTGRYEACQKTAQILTDNGGKGEVITLTELGIKGNTHLMMQDKNSSDVAKLIIDWLKKNVK